MGHVQASEHPRDDEGTATHDEITTAAAKDLEGQGIVKSDDSDGRVEWTWRQIFATLSLCGLYVGASPPFRLFLLRQPPLNVRAHRALEPDPPPETS